MTFGYRTDDKVIRALAQRQFEYFGVLGSANKIRQMKSEYENEKLDIKMQDNFFAPAGISIHSHTPKEIAISIAAQIIAEAFQYNIPEEDIWLDPIAPPIKTQQLQIQGCTEFALMIREAFPECKSIYGGSNISNGVPRNLRGMLNRTYLIMLKRYGIYSAIVDAFDSELTNIAEGRRPELEKLVYSVMDGDDIDNSVLSEEEIKYVKTTRVLLGQNLYSDFWLEL